MLVIKKLGTSLLYDQKVVDGPAAVRLLRGACQKHATVEDQWMQAALVHYHMELALGIANTLL